MAESTLNFVDGASRTLDWSITDTPGVRYDVQPVIPQIAAEVGRSSTFAWPGNNVDTLFTYNFKRWDTDGMVNLGTHNDRITIVTPGAYYVYASISAFQNGGPGRGPSMAEVVIFLNGLGVNTAITNAYTTDTITWGFAFQQTTVLRLAAGDYLSLHGFFDLNVTLTVTGATPQLGCYRLGPSPP